MPLTTEKNNFWKEAKERWSKKSPPFFQKILKFAIELGTAAVAVLGADKLFDLQATYGVSPLLFTACGYIIVFCAALGLTAKITKQPDGDNQS
jgi:hypothetical protein